ncbi:MAG TPA: hypothetical protein VID24_08720 [Candidatus Eremiobacteraceae bacterium]|jgi:hypothetical protein
MIARPFDPVAELQSAFTVLFKNYALAVIPLVALIICFALFAIVAIVVGGSALLASFGTLQNNPTALWTILAASLPFFGIAGLVAFVIALIADGATVAAAESAWSTGVADISGGFSRAMSKLGDLVVAAIVLLIICAVLAITFVGPLILLFLMLYVLPAIVVGGESAFQAMGTSWNLATKNFGATFAAFIGIVLVAVVAMVVNAVLHYIPVLGWLASLALNGLLSAFGALVVVRFYDLLRGSATATAAPPPPPPVS